MDEQKPLIGDTHQYDGIVEEQNNLPRWWLYLFYLCVIFSIAYVAYYHLMGGKSINATFRGELDRYEKEFAPKIKGKEDSAEDLAALVANPAVIEKGKISFLAKCSPCHGPQGQGVIGPNLTDDFWIHGDGKMAAMLSVVREGVPAKGMPGWAALMSDDELKATVAYAKSLRGSKPANGKGPEGAEHKE